MKEKFDISHYLNIEMPPELKQSLLDFHSKRPISAKLEKKQAEQSESSQHSSASEQTLPSEPLTEVKEAVKAEFRTGEATSGIKQSETHQPQATTRELGELSRSLSLAP